MKKLVFVFAALVAFSFASCGNQTSEASVINDSDSVVVVDSCNCDSCTSCTCDTACCD